MLQKVKEALGIKVSHMLLEHERLTRMLHEMDPTTDEYAAVNRERHKIKEDLAMDVRSKIDKTALFKVAAIGGMVLFVLKYEEAGVITSKLWSPLSGLFFRGV